MERREHHRAQLCLPVRLRWTTPFGQKIEVCETLDVSRGGLRVPCGEEHAPGVPLWVTFPYDLSMGDGQPEVLARVVRTTGDGAQNGNGREQSATDKWFGRRENETRNERQLLALRFESGARAKVNGNGYIHEPERRASARRRLAVPIRARTGNVPWFEEAMTLDVSAQGLRFLSNREYKVGEHLFVSFTAPETAPWVGGKEFRSRVVRAETVPESAALAISLARLP
jgi:PilZ domain